MEATIGQPVLPADLEGLLLAFSGLLALVWIASSLLAAGRWRRVRRLLLLACLLCIFFVTARAMVVEPFYVPTPSMAPTLLEGDLILVQKYAYQLRLPILEKPIMKTGEYRRGDVVVFTLPDGTGTHYVKRVIGLPGDDVLFLGGRWYVNGHEAPIRSTVPFSDSRGGQPAIGRLQEEVLFPGKTFTTLRSEEKEVGPPGHWKIPEGNVFVLGDHRGMSKDSRFLGTIEQARVIGRVGRILFNTQGLDRRAKVLDLP